MGKVRLTVTITDEQHARLKALSAETGATINSLICLGVAQLLRGTLAGAAYPTSDLADTGDACEGVNSR